MKKQKKNKSINIKEANLYQKTKTNKSGITLIALVVTIVVLLILARCNHNLCIRWRWNSRHGKESRRKNKPSNR